MKTERAKDKFPHVSAEDLKRADETLRRMLASPPDPHVKKPKAKPLSWPRKAAK